MHFMFLLCSSQKFKNLDLRVALSESLTFSDFPTFVLEKKNFIHFLTD